MSPQNNQSDSQSNNSSDEAEIHSGFVAIIGRPNVGKSTLMNRILGQKVAITTPKPQTTRHRILGIKTTNDTQAIYVDTPGIHQNANKAMNRYLNRAAMSAIDEVDLVLFLVEANRWTDEDEAVLKRISKSSQPVMLVVNKVDLVKHKEQLLPFMQTLGERYDFINILPVSASKGDNLAALETEVRLHLPNRVAFYPEDQITDRSERFLAAELVREKLIMALEQELPYALTVEIERFQYEESEKEGGNPRLLVSALIWVEREGQKRIVIGKGGKNIKEVGKAARLDMNRLFEVRTHLEMWVKVKDGWANNERALQSLGYE